jgi:CelD/BcsL family acetyltransferase involved in cellulose biosynthesis
VQSFDFVRIWYETYSDSFSPILVSETASDGTLLGVLALAQTKADGSLVPASGYQGEYKGWLAPAGDGGRFITCALLLIRQEFPGDALTFTYLSPQTPLEFLSENPILRRFCKLQRYSRPLLFLNEKELAASLRKKSNKSRMNRLKALGEIVFERVTNAADAAALMDDVATLSDLRHGAAHNSLPFRRDPMKRSFFLALLDQTRLLHFTVLKVGGVVVGAHMGLTNGRYLQIGAFAHSVRLARHSPGKLHILMLGKLLLQEGIGVLDLTPGGDDWKERFASTHDDVFSLTMYGDLKSLLIARIKATARATARTGLNLIKRALIAMGLSSTRADWLEALLRKFAHPSAVGELKRAWSKRRPRRIYRYEFTAAPWEDVPSVLAIDRHADLLAFYPKRSGWRDHKEFLADASERLARGQSCCTLIDEDFLAFCGWLVPTLEDALETDVPVPLRVAHGSVLIIPIALGREDEVSFENGLKQMLNYARSIAGAPHAFVLVDADYALFAKACEKLSLSHEDGERSKATLSISRHLPRF